MDQHARRFVHSQDVVILVQNGQGPILAGVFRGGLVQQEGHGVAPADGEIGPLGGAVDQDPVRGLQPVHEAGGDPHFVF